MAKPLRPIVEIAPKTWLVSEYKLVNTYLVEGTERAILIDGGAGLGDLAADVRALTDKPIDVVVTHGDGDHTAAAGCFGKAYMHPLDKNRGEMFKAMGDTRAMAKFMVTTRGPVRNPETPVEELLALVPAEPLPDPVYEYVEEGHVFDLGGRTLEVILTPGHSDGSICLLDKENRLLFTGDACNDRLLVTGDDLKATLRREFVDIVYNTTLAGVTDEGALLKQGSDIVLYPCDTVILAIGTRADNKLAEELAETGVEVVTVGDAIKARQITQATREGFVAGLNA